MSMRFVMGQIAAVAYAVAAYAVGVAAASYGVGFLADSDLPKTINSGAAESWPAALAVDVLLICLFAAQHSVMARPGFKAWWTRVVPPPIERSTYVLASGLALAALFWQWRPLPGIIWEVRDPIGRGVVRVLSVSGWLIAAGSTAMLDHFELFGLRQVAAHLRGREAAPVAFRTPALYRVVRHPIMLGLLVAFWATPRMTAGYLLFAGSMTAYILTALRWEERDLERTFGEDYRQYRRRVPMVLPRAWP